MSGRPLPPRQFVAWTRFIAVGLAAAASGALAGEPPERSLDPVATVHLAELNTSTPEGSRILYDRISAAAQAVCSTGADWYPGIRSTQQKCFRETVDHVIDASKAIAQLYELQAAFHAAAGGAGVDAATKAEHLEQMLGLFTDDAVLIVGRARSTSAAVRRIPPRAWQAR